MPNPTIRQIASATNLRRAWLWVLSGSDAGYKSYFRHIYQAFALGSDETLADIRSRLLTGTYRPSVATKFFFPKSTGILRPVTLLGVEDQIVYQAYGNIIAEHLPARVRHRYNRSVFGNLYTNKNSTFFYADWHRSYPLYTAAMRRAFKAGYKWSASFDLTACYDSIDHSVLTYFLRRIRIDEESCEGLCKLLSHWTEASGRTSPMYHGHGIPQGPLTSGILSESVLGYFDDARRPPGVQYFRYVDDIRLFAKDEDSLRRELVNLDVRSKEVGLFPQAGKILFHRVKNIDDEIKSISNPPELGVGQRIPSQGEVRSRLTKLSPRFSVSNPTRFKYVLAQAEPNSGLARRLLEIVRVQPSYYGPVFRHLSKYPRLSSGVSTKAVDLLRDLQLYPSFSAALVRTIELSIHPAQRPRLDTFCRSRLANVHRDPELRAAAASALIRSGVATWAETNANARWSRNWWVRTEVIRSVDMQRFGRPGLETLCNGLIRDEFLDVSVVAAETMLSHSFVVSGPLGTVHPAAQRILRSAGVIGRVSTKSCYINAAVVELLGPQLRPIEWRQVLSARGLYKSMLPRFAQWRAYINTDPTAWVALTDTINDVLLDCLFRRDGGIGTYNLGSIGSALSSPTSRLANAYPSVHKAAAKFHELRLIDRKSTRLNSSHSS